MKTTLTTAMLIATMTITGHGQTRAPAAKGSFEQFWADAQKSKRADKSEASQKRMAWWRDARFGMFMCWTPCSIAACEIGFARESFDGGLGGLGISTGTNPRAELHKGSELDGFVDWMTPSVPKAVYDSIEIAGPGQTDNDNKWQARAYDINDPNNLGSADVKYWVVEGNVGAVEKFTCNGGASIRARRIGSAPAATK